jgi:hypothetical protein
MEALRSNEPHESHVTYGPPEEPPQRFSLSSWDLKEAKMPDSAPGQENERPTTAKQSAPDGNAEPPHPAKPSKPPQQPERPSQPEQSAEDTDSGWGERPDPSDDERLYGDRPPHWDSI